MNRIDVHKELCNCKHIHNKFILQLWFLMIYGSILKSEIDHISPQKPIKQNVRIEATPKKCVDVLLDDDHELAKTIQMPI